MYDRTPDAITLCAIAHIDDGTNVVGAFALSATGIRAAGLPVAQAEPVQVGSAYSTECTTVFTERAVAGAFVATAQLTAVGTSDVLALCQLSMEWGLTPDPSEVGGYCTDSAPGATAS